MKTLVLAPQMFFIERGTPIAVKLLSQVLGKRSRGEISLLTYCGGKDIKLDGVEHVRAGAPAGLREVGPGISAAKLVNDAFFFVALLMCLWRNRKNQFRLVHAVEESVFFAWLVKKLFNIPYVYDMDSCMSDQLVEKWIILKPVRVIFRFFEKVAVRNASAVVAVCDSLAETAKEFEAQEVQILRDIPLEGKELPERPISLRQELGLTEQHKIILYVGNLEAYQGIDLMVEGFAPIAKDFPDARLVIVGGSSQHQEIYRRKALEFDTSEQIIIAGKRPVDLLSHYLSQADILASPRTKGTNTPMKIYSYLHSGIPVIATKLVTHTQVMTEDFSKLVDPSPEAFAQGLAELLQNPEQAAKLGKAAKEYSAKNYTFEVFSRDLNKLYDLLELQTKNSGKSAQYQLSS